MLPLTWHSLAIQEEHYEEVDYLVRYLVDLEVYLVLYQTRLLEQEYLVEQTYLKDLLVFQQLNVRQEDQ